jgi:hypothetical protein
MLQVACARNQRLPQLLAAVPDVSERATPHNDDDDAAYHDNLALFPRLFLVARLAPYSVMNSMLLGLLATTTSSNVVDLSRDRRRTIPQ